MIQALEKVSPNGVPLLLNLCEMLPGNAELRFSLVRSLIRRGHFEEALQEIAPFLNMRINIFRSYMLVADIYFAMGKYPQSLSWLRMALAEGYQSTEIQEKICTVKHKQNALGR